MRWRYRWCPTAQRFLRPCRRTKDARCANYSSQPPKRHVVSPHPSDHIGTNSLQTRADQHCSASSLRRRERLIYTEVWFSLVTQPSGFTFKYDRGTGGCLKASECIFIKLYSNFTVFLCISLCCWLIWTPPPRTHTMKGQKALRWNGLILPQFAINPCTISKWCANIQTDEQCCLVSAWLLSHMSDLLPL